jgi:serine phosphatase RsbU (regulator of sigma subunit)
MADRRPDQFEGSLPLLEAVCRLAGRILVQHQDHEREHAAFEIIQEALVPPQAPVVDGLDVAVCFASATDIARIGGDFYDVVDRGDAGCMLFVGDYSGHGIEAAGMAARARYALAGVARHAASPGDLLAEANDLLAGVLPEDRYVSVAACMIDPAAGHVRLALAGHPAPIRLRGASATEIDAPPNSPLGLALDAHFAETETTLEQGDVLALITDGVLDSRRDGRLFGLEGIREVWLTNDPTDVRTLTCAVCEASGNYHDNALSPDDRLALGIRLAR